MMMLIDITIAMMTGNAGRCVGRMIDVDGDRIGRSDRRGRWRVVWYDLVNVW